MVRSWIPTFLVPFSFQSFFSNSSKNELWMGRCGGRGRAHHKYTLNSKHPSKKISLFIRSSSGYSIYSFAHLSSSALGRKNFGWWILDSYFSILFSSPFPFTAFFSKTCKTELWMVDLGLLRFSTYFPFKISFETMQIPLRMVSSWIPNFLMPFFF